MALKKLICKNVELTCYVYKKSKFLLMKRKFEQLKNKGTEIKDGLEIFLKFINFSNKGQSSYYNEGYL